MTHEGDSLRIVTPGGGGYGSPLERDFERVEEDVRQGFISREQAEREYRAVFAGDRIDETATVELRMRSAASGSADV